MARYRQPYRTHCVGVMLINAAGLVFIGRRASGIRRMSSRSHVWQMPQGGVDPGEDTWEAAKRELYEETSVQSVEKLGEVAEWLIYDIPRTRGQARAWKGRYRGQRQKWLLVRFYRHQGRRDQRRQPRRWPPGRQEVHLLALGADAETFPT